MEFRCDLEVDINGEETFMVDKNILANFSLRIGKVFDKMTKSTRTPKVIFQDFPGGAKGFEIMLRFCYNNGRTEISPSNIVQLNCAAHFMKMHDDFAEMPVLLHQTENCLENISYWAWSDLLIALKNCQGLIPATTSSVQRVLNCLVEKIAWAGSASPCTEFSGGSSFKSSCDTNTSSDSIKHKGSQKIWWCDDLLFLNLDFVDKLVKKLVLEKLNHAIICKFLFYYRKSRFFDATTAEKCEIMEVVVNLLCLLDRNSLPCKGLFDLFRVASSLKMSKCYKNKLEILMGSQLDRATVDYLLAPSPRGHEYMYDIDLVLRLAKAFLLERTSWVSLSRLKKVASLVDAYLFEVAADFHLRPSKFASLVMMVPDSGRDCHDKIYQAMDLYFEVCPGLCEEEKMRVCSRLNYDKLSTETLKQLAQNLNFPLKASVKALINLQSKFKSLMEETTNLKTFDGSLLSFDTMKRGPVDEEDSEHAIAYVKKVGISTENEKLTSHLEGMHWRVMKLESVCNIMQTQMRNIIQTRTSDQKNSKYLPKLCSC